jgi:hypothetical protein
VIFLTRQYYCELTVVRGMPVFMTCVDSIKP